MGGSGSGPFSPPFSTKPKNEETKKGDNIPTGLTYSTSIIRWKRYMKVFFCLIKYNKVNVKFQINNKKFEWRSNKFKNNEM